MRSNTKQTASDFDLSAPVGFWSRIRAKLWALILPFVGDLLSHFIATAVYDWSKSAIQQRGVREMIGTMALAIATHWIVVFCVLFSITVIIISVRASREIAAFEARHEPNTVPDIHDDSVPGGDDLMALQILGSEFRGYRVGELATALSVPKQKAQYHLDRLSTSGNAHRSVLDLLSGDHAYAISPKGREILVKRGLL